MSLWFYERDGKSNGPIDEDALAAMLGSAQISGDTRVWTSEFGTEWKTANETRLAPPPVLPPPLPLPSSSVKSGDTLTASREDAIPLQNPNQGFAYLLAFSPLLFTAAEVVVTAAQEQISDAAIITIYAVGFFAILFAAYIDTRFLIKAGLVPANSRMPAYVLLTPFAYFLIRTKATGKSSNKFVWIWLAAFLIAYNLPSEALGKQLGAQSVADSQGGFAVRTASAQASEFDVALLAEVGENVGRCWNIPANAREPFQLKLTLGKDGNPNGEVVSLSATETPVVVAARRAISRCAPYVDLIDKEPGLAGREIVLTFLPAAQEVTAAVMADGVAEVEGEAIPAASSEPSPVVARLAELGLADAVVITRPPVADFGDATLTNLGLCLEHRPIGTLPKEISISDEGYERYIISAITAQDEMHLHIVFNGQLAIVNPIEVNGISTSDTGLITKMIWMLFGNCPEELRSPT